MAVTVRVRACRRIKGNFWSWCWWHHISLHVWGAFISIWKHCCPTCAYWHTCSSYITAFVVLGEKTTSNLALSLAENIVVIMYLWSVALQDVLLAVPVCCVCAVLSGEVVSACYWMLSGVLDGRYLAVWAHPENENWGVCFKTVFLLEKLQDLYFIYRGLKWSGCVLLWL